MSIISKKALSKIKPNMTVSLGGGSNVLNLAKDLNNARIPGLRLYSPSEITKFQGKQLGLDILTLNDNMPKFDLAFDGCDSVDRNFNALKSGGGIHLFEKIAAENAKEYVLLLPKERFKEMLNPTVSLCIEIIPNCLNNLMTKIPQEYTAKVRLDQSVASFAHSPLGNLLIDIYPSNSWLDIEQLNDFLLKQNGVVSSSHFKNLVTSIITESNNKAIEIKKG
ncbi:ribose-5-phosphate isomerase A [Lactobacillus gasseri]|uniref:ribose-5-phosphate isomerase A n=1 Tax=Lactobacillus gasseri TaxID=1596 RepID=UPI0034A2F145